jgi:putative membrane protein
MRLLMLLALIAVLTSVSCYYPRSGHMMDYWNHMSWGYGGLFMWFIFLVLIGVLIYFIARGGKWMKRGTGEDSALEILKKRYAKGEITKQEYEKMKRDLD